MKKVIQKCVLKLLLPPEYQEAQPVDMPLGAEIVSVGTVFEGTVERPCMWVHADPRAVVEIRRFVLLPTGMEYDDTLGSLTAEVKFVGTIHFRDIRMPAVHIFEPRLILPNKAANDAQ